MNRHTLIVLLAFAAIATPSLVRADARLISVVPTDGGCVVGPTGPGVQHWDVEPGKTFELTIDHVVECASSVCTMPIQYCTTPGETDTGMFVRRNDGDSFQAHLRASSFGPGCTLPGALQGGDCYVSPTRSSTWARVKSFYR
jgi:hypothetical protein